MSRTCRVVWLGSNTAVADAFDLQTTGTLIFPQQLVPTTDALCLQEELLPLLKFQYLEEVKAFAGPHVLTPTPLQWLKVWKAYWKSGDAKEAVAELAVKFRPVWRYLLDNKDIPIVVTRHSQSEIQAAQLERYKLLN
jgi:hypothetical protein